ncbi:MAG: hypothetical protein PHT59_01480 [Candidatus Omnitrophica bacterium]|nr:hypothetical protein [Candidatus Omnitrophota bacterium]
MKTFAFLFNPVELKHIREFWPLTHLMPEFMLKTFLKNQGFKISPLKTFTSSQDQQVQGYFLVSPLLPEQDGGPGEELLLDKIITASFLARDLGAGLLGLGGYAQAVAEKKSMLYKHLKVPVTLGTNFTAWSAIEALYRIADSKKIELKKSTLCVSGATGAVGSLCCQKLAREFSKTIITAGQKDKLTEFVAVLERMGVPNVEVQTDVNRAIAGAEVVIVSGTGVDPHFSPDDLKAGAVVIDMCLSRHLAGMAHHRTDVTVINGGIIKLPPQKHGHIHVGLPKDMILASMAETMLLALEDKITLPATGETGNIEKLEPLADLAVRHGFEVYVPDAPLG